MGDSRRFEIEFSDVPILRTDSFFATWTFFSERSRSTSRVKEDAAAELVRCAGDFGLPGLLAYCFLRCATGG